MLMRRIRAMQRFHLRLRRLRKCFRIWAAASQLQSAVLSALSTIDSDNLQGSPRPSFARVRPQAHAAVQTSCIHPSFPVVIRRLAIRSLLPFVYAWKHISRRCSARRKGRKLICSRVMRVWTGRPKGRTPAQYEVEDSDFCNDEQLWSELISPNNATVTKTFSGRGPTASSFSTPNKDALPVATPTVPVSRRCLLQQVSALSVILTLQCSLIQSFNIEPITSASAAKISPRSDRIGLAERDWQLQQSHSILRFTLIAVEFIAFLQPGNIWDIY